MLTEKNLEKLKNILRKNSSPTPVRAQNSEFNRKILEYGKLPSLVFPSLEKNNKRSLRLIDSGLNHISLKAATKNKISIVFDLNIFRSLSKEEKAKALESFIQNIKLARKTKTKIKLLNFKDKKDAFSFLQSIGASSSQAKEAISF